MKPSEMRGTAPDSVSRHPGYTPPVWDIFCTVVDNYGDAGVCWRLARQLAAEHGIHPRLWMDDLRALQKLCPDVDLQAATQTHSGVEVRHWKDASEEPNPGAVVIEAFGCRLPDAFEALMAAMHTTPCWINLEYLSAEDWVTGAHKLPSPHPQLPLTKYFFLPGFTADTGGLLREGNLLEERDSFQANSKAQASFWAGLNVPPAMPEETRVSLFCYPVAPVAELLTAISLSEQPTRVLLPEGVAVDAVQRIFGTRPVVGQPLVRGALTIHPLPFLPQPDYDRLLWACDINFVRGEDSFVRAQWAGRPFVWHIYPQAEAAHVAKLAAFFSQYTAELESALGMRLQSLWQVWNGLPVHPATLETAWSACQQALPGLERHSAAWCRKLAGQPDLATQLVQFARKAL